MHQAIRLAQLEEICMRVARSDITQELIEKAINLQSKKVQGQIRQIPDAPKPKIIRKPRATK